MGYRNGVVDWSGGDNSGQLGQTLAAREDAREWEVIANKNKNIALKERALKRQAIEKLNAMTIDRDLWKETLLAFRNNLLPDISNDRIIEFKSIVKKALYDEGDKRMR